MADKHSGWTNLTINLNKQQFACYVSQFLQLACLKNERFFSVTSDVDNVDGEPNSRVINLAG